MPSWMLRTHSEAACLPLTYFSKYTPARRAEQWGSKLRCGNDASSAQPNLQASEQQWHYRTCPSPLTRIR